MLDLADWLNLTKEEGGQERTSSNSALINTKTIEKAINSASIKSDMKENDESHLIVGGRLPS